MSNKKEKIIEWVWIVVVIVLFIVSLKMVRSGELEAELSSFGVLAPIVLVILKMGTLIIAPLGGSPLYLISGALFGSVEGFLLSLLGDVLGTSVCFLLSRRYGERVIRSLAGSSNVDRVLGATSLLHDTRSFVKARFAFISIPELLAYAAGLSKLNFWKFSIINALFYIPIDFVLVFLGSRIANLSGKYILIYPAIIFLLAFVGFISLYKDYQNREGM